MDIHARLEELRALAADAQDRLAAIHEGAVDDKGEARSLDADESAEFDFVRSARDAIIAEGIDLEARAEVLATSIERPEATERAFDAPNIVAPKDPHDLAYQRDAGPIEAAKRYVGESGRLADEGRDRITELMENRSGNVYVDRSKVARHVLAHGSDDYSRAFAKKVTGRSDELTEDERRALEHARQESRAINITTDASGAVLMPTHLDPTVIYSGTGSINPIRQVARVVTVAGDNWNGVTSTGVTASWDTESAEVSDDTPTFAQPSISVHKGQAFVPVSYEALEDFDGLANDVAVMFRDAKDDLEATGFATGTGTNQPTGIVTALIGGPNYTAMATNSTFAVGDLFTAAEALPARYRGQSPAWVMNQVHINDVMEFGGTSYYTRSTTLDQGPSGSILGPPVYESSAFSSTLDGDTNNNIVYGVWSNYVIADRIGAAVRFIPDLFATGNNRPSGQSGWHLHWRVGADSVNDTAFVLLYNPST